jgi:hypothetical protein
MIPDKTLFIVTSSLKPAMGVFKDDERFSQTVASLKSIREKVPEAIILFADVSVRPVSQLEKETLASLSNYYLDLSEEPNTRYCAINGLKSHGENCLLFATIATLKQDIGLSKMLSSVNRIFKFSARSELEDSFNIKDYDNTFGKFVFKKRIPTWTGDVKFGADHLLITRMWSMCPSLIDTYLSVIQENLKLLSNGIADTEHAHFVNIPKQYLTEFDKIHCWGWLAGNGQIEHY